MNSTLNRVWLAGFVLILSVILAGGWWFYHAEAEQLRGHINEELETIAHLKVKQLVAWRAERLGDAYVTMQSPEFMDEIANWMKSPDAVVTEKILARFRSMVEYYKYSNILLVDLDGQTRLSLNGLSRPLVELEKQDMAAALRDRRAILTDLFFLNGEAARKLDAVAPCFQKDGDATKAIGAIFLEVDAGQFLYPVVQSWPTPSQTAEITLLRQEGGDVLFLNDMRHQTDTALRLHVSLKQPEKIEAMAAMGTRGLVDGLDYRGTKVLAVLDAIPDSPWLLTTKEDESEAFAPLRQHLWVTIVILSLLTAILTQAFILLQLQASAAATLREREENLSVTLQSIGDAVLATDATGRVSRMNPIAEKLTGWTQDEARGRPVAEVFHIINEMTRQPAFIPVDAVLATGEIHGLANHTVVIARDGTERAIADSAAPIRSKDGKILGVVLVFRDVTEEKKAEKAIQDSELLQRAVLNSVRAIIAVVDHRGTIIAVNNGWERFAQENSRDLKSLGVGVGANYFDVCVRDQDLGDQGQMIVKGIRGVLENSHESFYCEYAWNSSRQQQWYTMQVSRLARGEGGAVIAQINITERKLAEEALLDSQRRLRLALEAARIGDWELDLVTQSARRSLRHDQIFGYTELLPEWNYTLFLKHVHPDDRDRIDQTFKESTAAGRDWYFECRIIRANQTEGWIWARASIFKDSSGKATMMLGMIGDISDRKQSEDKLREAHDLLRKSTGELEAFNRAMVGREQRIIEMKEEVNALCSELGREPEYPPVWKS